MAPFRNRRQMQGPPSPEPPPRDSRTAAEAAISALRTVKRYLSKTRRRERHNLEVRECYAFIEEQIDDAIEVLVDDASQGGHPVWLGARPKEQK